MGPVFRPVRKKALCFPPAWGMLMSPAGKAATPPPLLCRHPAPFCGYKGQFRQYTGSAFLHTQAPGKLLHIIASLHTQARRMFLHVIANQCAHWCGNPYSLRWGVAESSAQGEYGKAVNLPR